MQQAPNASLVGVVHCIVHCTVNERGWGAETVQYNRYRSILVLENSTNRRANILFGAPSVVGTVHPVRLVSYTVTNLVQKSETSDEVCGGRRVVPFV